MRYRTLSKIRSADSSAAWADRWAIYSARRRLSHHQSAAPLDLLAARPGAVAAPCLGLGLGSVLGGKSIFGNILGAIGGGAVGLGASFGASVFGAGGGLASAGLAALGPVALIGAPLLIGAILLGKAKQRRSDEQAAGELLGQALAAIDQLANGISTDQIDGSQAKGIFENQILGQFRQQISTLK